METNTLTGNNPLRGGSGAGGSHEPVRLGATSNSPENAQTSKPSNTPNPKISKPKTPKLVERHTALRGASISPVRKPQSVTRKNTWDDLNEREPEIPYLKVERANRDLVCSLMERQDRMNEQLFLNINDMQYRLDDLEFKVEAMSHKKNSGKPEVTA